MPYKLNNIGYSVMKTGINLVQIEQLRATLFSEGKAGARCLLDDAKVCDVSRQLKDQLSESGFLSPSAIAIQAIAFDKTANTNWQVTWHQDLMFPFASHPQAADYTLSCEKDGVVYARPPLLVLEQLTAVRLHLDDCDEGNGPLKISPGSHQYGIVKSEEVVSLVQTHGEVTCLAREGEVILMKVLALHSSSKAIHPVHRRVLHIVYHSGDPITEKWHRAVG
jgi:ectoine hydroxylase-related dioxygenase (phytanoyl-CoA dioxygenase family)